jgi:hypothetical protein
MTDVHGVKLLTILFLLAVRAERVLLVSQVPLKTTDESLVRY